LLTDGGLALVGLLQQEGQLALEHLLPLGFHPARHPGGAWHHYPHERVSSKQQGEIEWIAMFRTKAMSKINHRKRFFTTIIIDWIGRSNTCF
jgi:hypothetical protein